MIAAAGCAHLCTSGSYSVVHNFSNLLFTGEQSLNSLARPSPKMKNPYEVVRSKEQELIRIRKEMDALRIAARLLGAEDKAIAKGEPPSQLTRVVEMP